MDDISLASTSFSCWRQAEYLGTVVCNNNGVQYVAENTSIRSFESFIPNGAFVRILTCSLKNILSSFPDYLSNHYLKLNRFPERSECIGPVFKAKESEMMVQIFPCASKGLYECHFSTVLLVLTLV